MPIHKSTHMLCMHTTTSPHPIRDPASRSPSPSHKPTSTLLNRLFPRTTLQAKAYLDTKTHSISYTQTLCPPCITTWRDSGIDEAEAKARTLDYRILFHYHGALTPVCMSAGQTEETEVRMVLLSQDGEKRGSGFGVEDGELTAQYLNSNSKSRFHFSQALAPTTSRQGSEYNHKLEQWWTNEADNGKVQHPYDRDSNTTSLSSTTSSDNSMHIDRSREGNNNEADIGMQPLHPTPASTSRVSLDRYFIIETTPSEQQRAPTRRQVRADLRAEYTTRLDSPLPVLPGFEPLALQAPRKKPVLAVTERKEVRNAPDFDKPLPMAPRPDTPIPGAGFSSEIPERDLPRNLYYPRFI